MGGYGRGELSPHSDVDLLVLSPGPLAKSDLRGLLYPLWDAGFTLGHTVATPRVAVERARADLHAATSMLSARVVVGDADVFDEFHARLQRWLEKDRKGIVRRLVSAAAERHARADRAGWALAPDLKHDIGGLRDLHHLDWLRAVAGRPERDPELDEANEFLLATREALHALTRRPLDRLRMDLQPKVASAFGLDGRDGVDELVTSVHATARTVEHLVALRSADVTETTLAGPRRSGDSRPIAPGVRVADGRLVLEQRPADIATALRMLAAHARTERPIDRHDLTALATAFATHPVHRWDAAMRRAFCDLLAAHRASSALELLDHLSAWPVLLPEWQRIRGLAQHDPYHRYTVDGHSFLAVEEVTRAIAEDPTARTAANEAGDLSTLYLGTLLHDVGKGSDRDHCIAGEGVARAACARIGLADDDSDEVAALVRHHLLLPDTATRRDLDDGAVIGATADAIGSPRLLRLLYVLAVADGRATGPEAWNSWKAALVHELYTKTLIALEKGDLPARRDVAARAREVEAYEPSLAGRAAFVLATLPPSYLDSTSIPEMVDELRLIIDEPAPNEVRWTVEPAGEAGETALIVCVVDRPGALARTAGTLTLNRIGILRAQAFSTTRGLALQRFVVREDGTSWERVAADLESAYSGRLALDAQLARKVRDYRPVIPVVPDVRVLDTASSHSTVIEVRAPDALGLLYAIAAALAELDLDIHVAKIDTLGARVVDVFYVRTLWGAKLEPDRTDAVERAIRHRVEALFG